MGDPKRQNSRNERLIVNSLGEGAIWVCNSNGNIENSNYIQSSDHLGYGEKQDNNILNHYTVAKATIDCNFELDSPYYNCLEIENGLRIASSLVLSIVGNKLKSYININKYIDTLYINTPQKKKENKKEKKSKQLES